MRASTGVRGQSVGRRRGRRRRRSWASAAAVEPVASALPPDTRSRIAARFLFFSRRPLAAGSPLRGEDQRDRGGEDRSDRTVGGRAASDGRRIHASSKQRGKKNEKEEDGAEEEEEEEEENRRPEKKISLFPLRLKEKLRKFRGKSSLVELSSARSSPLCSSSLSSPPFSGESERQRTALPGVSRVN